MEIARHAGSARKARGEEPSLETLPVMNQFPAMRRKMLGCKT
jgi:hypothetical protein